MPRWLERNYPRMGAVVAGALWVVLRRKLPLPAGTTDVLRAVVTAAAMGLGFLMTSTSILLALNQRWIIQRAQQEGAYTMVIDYLLAACRWCMLLAGLSAAALVADIKNPAWWHAYAFGFWVGLATGTGLAVYRIMYFLTVILRSTIKPEE